MKKLSLAYFGTPDFSAKFLEKLLASDLPVEIKLVVTQPDKKVGRNQIITPSPVKLVAQKHKILVKDSLHDFLVTVGASSQSRSPKSQKSVTSSSSVDLALLFAYGDIIPKEILKIPTHGFWNIHPSLLPKYRGASPIAFPLMSGDKETGVTLIQMDEVMDHGPIIAQQKTEILPKEKRNELTDRLVEVAFELFGRCILHLAKDELVYSQAQDETAATYTELLTKQHGFIPLDELKIKIEDSPVELFNKFRGLYPWPGIWTEVDLGEEKKRLKIIDMDLEDGKLTLKKVQLEGKNEVDFRQFNESYKLF